jgi:mono/diheme cytochrome c family protein
MWKLTMKSSFLIAGAALLACTLPNKFEATLLGADNSATSKESVQFFKDKVRPILTQNCYTCHTDTEMGHLRVDSREGLLKGGGRGPAIVPGDPEKSLLIEAVRQTGALKMPVGGKLDEQQIADLVAWIKMGAPWEQAERTEPKVPVVSAPADASSAGEDFFETKVRPIFANICSNCHGDAATSGLRVDSRELLLKGGSRGPAIVPNDPDKSLMIQAVRQTGELKMPKGGKLTPEEVQSLTDWVKMGAPWPRSKPT